MVAGNRGTVTHPYTQATVYFREIPGIDRRSLYEIKESAPQNENHKSN